MFNEKKDMKQESCAMLSKLKENLKKKIQKKALERSQKALDVDYTPMKTLVTL